MKSKTPANSFQIPRGLGQTEAVMIAADDDDLTLFRERMTPMVFLQILSMALLSGQKEECSKTIKDIALAMGYEPDEKTGKITSFAYREVAENMIFLATNLIPMEYRTEIGETTDGRSRFKYHKKFVHILESFEFTYAEPDKKNNGDDEEEDDESSGQDGQEKKALAKWFKVDCDNNRSYRYLALTDKNGNYLKDKDGKIIKKKANGLSWEWSNYWIKWSNDPENQWFIRTELLPLLRKYLKREATFRLMVHVIFWFKKGYIEKDRDGLIKTMGLRGKDKKQVDDAIKAAFEDCLKEGIIDHAPTIVEAGYYKPSEKTGKERRKGKTWRYIKGKKWRGKGWPEEKEDKPLTGNDIDAKEGENVSES